MRVPDWMVGRIFEPLWDIYEGSVRLQTMRELTSGQFDAPEVMDRRRAARLRDIAIEACAHVPFWRRRFGEAGIDPSGVESISDLAALPLLTKDDVRAYPDDLLSDRFTRDALIPAKTGGSTGTALHVYCDPEGIQRRNGAALHVDRWSGWRLGQPQGAVWGNPPRSKTLKNRIRHFLKDRVIYLDTMKLDEAAVRNFVADWRRLKPGLLFGHAHSLFLLAEMLRDMGEVLRPVGIVATSMMLLEPERRVIEEVFGVPVTNRYGCEEVSLIACECERHDGLHVNAEHCWVELLRDDGSACGPGEDGRIVVTEFVNRGMPMLRYEVGDRGYWLDGPCACGRPHRRLGAVTGRVADFLIARDGSRVAGISLIENTLTRYPGLAQMQVVQESRDHLVLNLVKGPTWRDEILEPLVATFQQALGGGLEITPRFLPRIPREANGKYRFSISRVQHRDGAS